MEQKSVLLQDSYIKKKVLRYKIMKNGAGEMA